MPIELRGRDINKPFIVAVRNAMTEPVVYIVGKGPSLDTLDENDFADYPGAPILCLNESIRVIEKLSIPSERIFCVQHDRLGDVSNKPSRGTWLLSDYAWAAQEGGANGALQFTLNEVFPGSRNLTACTALSIAALAGATKAVMLGFDAAITGDCEYAPSLCLTPELPNKDPQRFASFARGLIPSHASDEGMQLVWQAPKDFWHIAVVLKSGPKYNLRHARHIVDQLKARIKTPHKVLLFTDFHGLSDCKTVELVRDWPGWFSKLEIFDPALGIRGGMLYIDLGCVLGRDIHLPRWDEVLVPGRLRMSPTNNSSTTSDGRFFSGLIAWLGGSVTEPFTSFLKHPQVTKPEGNQSTVWGDQNIINQCMDGYIDDIYPLLEAKSYKRAGVKAKEEADVVLFHGHPKPWEIAWTSLVPTPLPEESAAGVDYAAVYNSYWNEDWQKGRPSSGLAEFGEEAARLFVNKKILDVGCGEGWLCEYLVGRRVLAYGTDVSKVAIARAEKKLPHRFLAASVLALPYPNRAFDGAVSTDLMEHLAVEDIPLALSEIRRVIRELFFVQVSHAKDARKGIHLTVKTAEWWQQVFAEAGFTVAIHPFKSRFNNRTTFLLTKTIR